MPDRDARVRRSVARRGRACRRARPQPPRASDGGWSSRSLRESPAARSPGSSAGRGRRGSAPRREARAEPAGDNLCRGPTRGKPPAIASHPQCLPDGCTGHPHLLGDDLARVKRAIRQQANELRIPFQRGVANDINGGRRATRACLEHRLGERLGRRIAQHQSQVSGTRRRRNGESASINSSRRKRWTRRPRTGPAARATKDSRFSAHARKPSTAITTSPGAIPARSPGTAPDDVLNDRLGGSGPQAQIQGRTRLPHVEAIDTTAEILRPDGGAQAHGDPDPGQERLEIELRGPVQRGREEPVEIQPDTSAATASTPDSGIPTPVRPWRPKARA
jgi:hypothetical protein